MRDALASLREVVSPSLLKRTQEISQKLSALGIPHAIIGGLAVGIHGHPRATKDIDFLVGESAFERTSPFIIYREELREIVALGVTDLLGVPPKYPWLREELRLEAGVSVISLRGLILMKLDAFRAQDKADIRALLSGDQAKIRIVRSYLKECAPTLLPKLAEVVAERT